SGRTCCPTRRALRCGFASVRFCNRFSRSSSVIAPSRQQWRQAHHPTELAIRPLTPSLLRSDQRSFVVRPPEARFRKRARSHGRPIATTWAPAQDPVAASHRPADRLCRAGIERPACLGAGSDPQILLRTEKSNWPCELRLLGLRFSVPSGIFVSLRFVARPRSCFRLPCPSQRPAPCNLVRCHLSLCAVELGLVKWQIFVSRQRQPHFGLDRVARKSLETLSVDFAEQVLSILISVFSGKPHPLHPLRYIFLGQQINGAQHELRVGIALRGGCFEPFNGLVGIL